MRWRLVVSLLTTLLFDAGLRAQSALPEVDLPKEVLALARVKFNMRRSLEQTPNYTCLQTIERTRLGAKARKKWKKRLSTLGLRESSATMPLDSTDTVRLEVAIVDGEELYSWPGADNFEDRAIAEIVGFGTLSSGDFANHAHSIFVASLGSIRFAGEETLQSRPALRYDYAVSLFQSNYVVGDRGGQASVAYSGSFWADPETHELLRLARRVDDVPPHLEISQVLTQVDYASFSIGETQLRLPEEAWMVTSFRSGAENTNRVHFSDCREFQAESEVSFGDPGPAVTSEMRLEDFAMPAAVSLPLRLETPIDSETSQVGDEIRARISGAVKKGDQLIAPKGALVLGRIRRLERYTEPRDYFILGIEFRELQYGPKRARFRARLEHVAPLEGAVNRFGEDQTRIVSSNSVFGVWGVQKTSIQTDTNAALPGTAEFYLQGKGFHFKAGLAMIWKTEEIAAAPESQPASERQ